MRSRGQWEKKKRERGKREIFRAADGKMKVLIMAYGPDCVFVFVCNLFIQ